jgi:dTDP-4-dehydrorhamnose reductase
MAKSGPILIAGKTGRLAQALIGAADRLGAAVRALGRPQLDIEDRDSIARVMAAEAPRAIVNAAGHVAVDDAERNPVRAFAVNSDGAAHLAAAAARAGIPFVHVSSDYVFDGSKMAPYVEDDVPAPLSVYGRSKAAGERAVIGADPSAIVVRTSWVYGPHGTNFLTTMLHLAETQDIVRVVADQYGTPTADTDLAHALLAIALRRLDQPAEVAPGIYHVAGTGETTWLGFAEAIFSGWARRGHRVPTIEPISLSDWHGPARRPRYSRLDCSKAERTFGIRLPDWEDSLELCLESLARDRTDAGRM